MYKHSIQFEMISSNNQIYCYIQVEGKLTHEDYQFFVPEFESVISNIEDTKVSILVDITKLQGWDLHAAWDDLKFSLKHGKEFNKIAVVGHNMILEYATKISSWFIPYEAKFFDDMSSAKDWLLN